MASVTLAVAGVTWRGWQSVSLRRSLDDFAGGWDLSVTERWPGQPGRREIKAGMPCALGLDGLLALSGFIDAVDIDYGKDAHSVRISGRGVAGDLVDCDALPPWEYKGLDLVGLVSALGAPFGLRVQAECPVGGAFERFSINPGEAVFTALERACRMRAVLPTTDTRNTIILTRAGLGGSAPVALELGRNILRASRQSSWAERFSEVHVLGQQENRDEVDAEEAAGPAAVAKDAEITRFRPKILLGEAQGGSATLAERARWQVAVARGRGGRSVVTLQGWRAGELGPLWRPNWLVRMIDPLLGIDGTWLVSGVVMTLDRSQGSLTTLTLVPPEAFSPAPGGRQA